MPIKILKLFVVLLFVLLQACSGGDSKPYNRKYDPSRNPAADLKLAMADAQTGDRRILLILGGDWCHWCHVLEAFLKTNKEMNSLVGETFVVMKVNASPQNWNKEFLSGYQEINVYPYFIILNKNGRMIGSQDPSAFEEGGSYSVAAFKGFVKSYRKRDVNQAS